ncbi:MAG: 2'-5' RNA ligase family protein [Devosia sp.]|uniref:2'-5' RNA ligase family protein n=1 Tax=Devosia sp. TaxID=1871048 RepID=UPI0024CB9DC8|nr:2'-5' RNA ligase family protein [Devosia sp.]UYO00971.1 MAG: 2'-5' RNA ligase family protein [Devosia sp.]
MALAVSLLFDSQTDADVRRIWKTLADSDICRAMLDLDYAPHVSLVVVDDDAAEPALRSALEALASPGFSLCLGPPRSFAGTSIGWLACGASPDLDRLHQAVSGALPLEKIRPHYRPGSWTPHMTLQMDGDIAAGLAVASSAWPTPRMGQVIRVELARFMPVVALGGVDLN